MLNTVPCRYLLSIPPDNHLLVDRSFVFAFVFAFVFVFVSVFLFVFLQVSAFSSPRSPFSVSTSRAASPLPFAGTQCWKILSFDLHYVFCLFSNCPLSGTRCWTNQLNSDLNLFSWGTISWRHQKKLCHMICIEFVFSLLLPWNKNSPFSMMKMKIQDLLCTTLP